MQVKKAYCFTDNGFFIQKALYSDQTGDLILQFTRDYTSFIIRKYNIDNSEDKTIYASRYQLDPYGDIDLSPDGKTILLHTMQRCSEYSLVSGEEQIIRVAQKYEYISTSYYSCGSVHIGIMTTKSSKNINNLCNKPRCEIYNKDATGKYVCSFGYLIQNISESVLSNFIFDRNAKNSYNCIRSDNSTRSFILKGFFYECSTENQQFMSVDKINIKNNTIRKSGKMHINPFDYVLVCFEENAGNDKTPANCTLSAYNYLSTDRKTAISIQGSTINIFHLDRIIDNALVHQSITCKDPNKKLYNEIDLTQHIVMIKNHHIICCQNGYHLIPIDLTTGQVKDEIIYEPGLSICGCSFQGVSTDNDTTESIKNNGGIL